MRKLFTPVVIVVCLLIGAPSAVAATEVGDACIGDEDLSAPVTLFELSAAANPLPLTTPSGVLTKWKVNVLGGVPFTFPQTLKVLRLDPATHNALTVGENTVQVGSGLNTFDTRIPVQEGDRVSIFGSGMIEALVCESPGESNLIGAFEGNGGGVGSSTTYVEVPGEFRIPVVGVVEPDADGDGYGDETQDKCPQSAAVQVDCPVVVLDSYVIPGRGKVVVLVTTSTEAPVTVSATAKLPKTRKKAKASATAKVKKVTRTIGPGKIGRFMLKFPGSLKKALKALPKGKKLRLKITATATNVAGQVSTDKATLKLPGQLKAVKKKVTKKG